MKIVMPRVQLVFWLRHRGTAHVIGFGGRRDRCGRRWARLGLRGGDSDEERMESTVKRYYEAVRIRISRRRMPTRPARCCGETGPCSYATRVATRNARSAKSATGVRRALRSRRGSSICSRRMTPPSRCAATARPSTIRAQESSSSRSRARDTSTCLRHPRVTLERMRSVIVLRRRRRRPLARLPARRCRRDVRAPRGRRTVHRRCAWRRPTSTVSWLSPARYAEQLSDGSPTSSSFAGTSWACRPRRRSCARRRSRGGGG